MEESASFDSPIDAAVNVAGIAILAEQLGEVPDRIHHYSTAAGLLGILEARAIWATDSRFLNDRTEFAHGVNVCRAALDETEVPERFARICRTVSRQLTGNGFLFFSASFCEADDLIPQWRGYGAHGAGYALGFETRQLVDLEGHFFLLRVRYKNPEKETVARSVVAAYSHLWGELSTKYGETPRVIMSVGTSLLASLTILSVSFKPEIFSHEREWRVATILDRDDASEISRISFRDATGIIVPYVALPLVDELKGVSRIPVVSVRIGPVVANDATQDAIALLARNLGLEIQISSSAAPLRF